MDLLQLAKEPAPQAGQELRVWLRGAQQPCSVCPAYIEPLLQVYFQQGQVSCATPCTQEALSLTLTSISRTRSFPSVVRASPAPG